MTATVAKELRDDDDGEYDHQLLDLEETLVLEPTLVLGLLVLWAWILLVMVVLLAQMLVLVMLVLAQRLVVVMLAQMVVVVEGLETIGGDIAAPGDLCLLRFGAMEILLSPMSCLPMYELTARYLSVLLEADVLVLLLSHPG